MAKNTATKRRDRTPFSANKTRLSVKFVDPDFEKKFHPHWFNDVDDRIARAIDAEYQFVKPEETVSVGDRDVHGGNTDLNDKISRMVNGRSGGHGEVRAILMKLKIKDYKADQKLKSRQNAMITESIRAGNPGGASVGNQYGEIKIS